MLFNMVVANSTLNLLTASPIGKRATLLILGSINMNWFFINSKLLTIYTYGTNRPSKTYSFEDIDEFYNKVEMFKEDGYQLIKDQA